MEGVKFTKWLVAAVIGLIVLAIVALWDRGAERKPFRVSSRDGSCVMEGVLKKRWFKTGSYGWIFSDTEELWVGAEAWIRVGPERYPLPRAFASKLSNTDKNIRILDCRHDGSRLEVKIDGGDGAGGMLVTLVIDQGKLVSAEALTVASDTPRKLYP